MNYIGCSGFMYDHWKRTFYPPTISKNTWFEYYVRYFNTVELNVTFYRLPRSETVQNWRERTPDNFVFSLKGSRYITHVKRLNDVSEAVDRFFDRASGLGRKLHVVLWQFPPRFRLNIERLEAFLSLLKTYNMRNVFEFRDETWICPDVEVLLKKSGYAFCVADWPEFLKEVPITSDYTYIRRHGEGGKYDILYSEEQLKADRNMIRRLRKKGCGDVFVYFNNDYRGYAPQNALMLKKMLS